MTVLDPDKAMNAFVEKHILRAGLHYRQNPNLARTKISKNVKPQTGVPKIGKNLGVVVQILKSIDRSDFNFT